MIFLNPVIRILIYAIRENYNITDRNKVNNSLEHPVLGVLGGCHVARHAPDLAGDLHEKTVRPGSSQ